MVGIEVALAGFEHKVGLCVVSPFSAVLALVEGEEVVAILVEHVAFSLQKRDVGGVHVADG